MSKLAPGQMPEWTSKWSWMARSSDLSIQEINVLGRGAEVGIRLKVDKHAGEP